MEGNRMKIREALERLDALNLNVLKYPLDGDSSEIYDADKKPIPLPAWGVATLLNGAKEAQVLARAALSAPARNCDVGKDVRTLLEEYIAMRGFTSDNQIRALYELALPVIEWCLSPAKEPFEHTPLQAL